MKIMIETKKILFLVDTICTRMSNSEYILTDNEVASLDICYHLIFIL